jgi:AraC-like DNA-binding protein
MAEGCRVLECDAPSDLSPFVAKLVSVQTFSRYVRFRVLDGCCVLGFGVNCARNEVASYVMSPWSYLGNVQVEDGWKFVEARFRWGAGPAFLRCSPQDLGHAVASPYGLFGAAWEQETESLAAARDVKEMMELFTGFLRRAAPDRLALHPAVRRAVQILERSERNIRVAELADGAYISASQLRRLFASQHGLSPSQSIRVRRLWRAMDHSRRNSFGAWSASAVEAGFCDQAHLVDEFRRLTGLTPTKWQATLTGVVADAS